MPKSSTTKRRTAGNTSGVNHAKARKLATKPSPAKSSVMRSRKQSPAVKSDAFEAIHSAASDLHSVGAIGKQTMRSYDALCIVPPKQISPNDIQELRLKLGMSQAVFARRIGASPSTVEKWESGVNKPTGIALRFLHAVAKLGARVLE